MAAVMDNLFTLAGVGPITVLPEADAGDEAAQSAPEPQEAPAAATAPHPARNLQDGYVCAILASMEARRAVEHANNVVGPIGSHLGSFDVSFLSLHRDAVNALVQHFKDLCMCGDAKVDSQDEFRAVFGENLTEEIFESGSGRHHHHRRYRDDLEEEKRTSPEDIRIDLIKLWDGLAEKYADGGVRLLRSQAAARIINSWSLRDKPFEVVNGKALIEDRVWSEKSYRGVRTLSYSSREGIVALLRALDVFLEFAEVEGDALRSFFGLSSLRGDPEIISGTRYVVAKGDLEFRTYNDTWKWTLSARVADKLREFIVEYGNLGSD
jgi:hypothetical protein